MNPNIKAAFEKWLIESDGEDFFVTTDLSLNSDGGYADIELFGAFLAFKACWDARPDMGMFMDVTIGQLTQPASPQGAPAMNFSTQLYRLPPGEYTVHAVQRVADQSVEDVAAQLKEATA